VTGHGHGGGAVQDISRAVGVDDSADTRDRYLTVTGLTDQPDRPGARRLRGGSGSVRPGPSARIGCVRRSEIGRQQGEIDVPEIRLHARLVAPPVEEHGHAEPPRLGRRTGRQIAAMTVDEQDRRSGEDVPAPPVAGDLRSTAGDDRSIPGLLRDQHCRHRRRIGLGGNWIHPLHGIPG